MVFAEAIFLSQGKAQGWTFYLTSAEVVFEVALRLVLAAFAGIALGTISTALMAPVLWRFASSRNLLVDRTAQFATLLVIFLASRFAAQTLIPSLTSWTHRGEFTGKVLMWGYYLAFVAAVCIPRGRKKLLTSLDDFVGKKAARRMVIAVGVTALAVAIVGSGIGRSMSTVSAAAKAQQPKSNILLITFDALSAEDMSLYGCPRPTTPNIDAFAATGTVFTNFFSGSSFTTPSLATIITGAYPSQSHVHQLPGRVRSQDVEKSLPHVMRAAGYFTGAFVSNPWAYYFAESLRSQFDSLRAPVFEKGGAQRFFEATGFLHQNLLFGNRGDEYFDIVSFWNNVRGLPSDGPWEVRPDEVFQLAGDEVAKLPTGYFYWIHVLSPHDPYVPDREDQGRFLPLDKSASLVDEDPLRQGYPPEHQSVIDEHRLIYDEFIASADRAFGAFMKRLETGGKLRDTTVIVAADHGESFEGGIYRHRSALQTRPMIHVPLIIRTPNQQLGRRVVYTADQTALAPTIFELAGQAKPDRLPGQSLVPWLNGNGEGQGEGMAFTQYLERNSVFAPVRHGTVGVIDGQYQYVLDIATQTGALRPLKEAQFGNIDRSAENPARVEALRAAIFARFPSLHITP